MDNPEKWQHWVHKSQDKDKQKTTQKNKKMRNTDPIKFTYHWFSRFLTKLKCDKFTDINGYKVIWLKFYNSRKR